MPALSLLLILGLGVAAIFFGLNILKNYKPGRSRIQKDLGKIKSELQPWVNDLIPWNKEELEQLSLNVINKTRKKGVLTNVKGVFTTIYHEPLIAWYYRRYVAAGENAVLYMRTSKHEFVYRIKGEDVEVVIDDWFVGRIDPDGVLYDFKKKKALARINKQSELLSLPVLVNEKPVASLVNPAKASDKKNQRALDLVADMPKEEESMFLALSLLEMVRVQK